MENMKSLNEIYDDEDWLRKDFVYLLGLAMVSWCFYVIQILCLVRRVRKSLSRAISIILIMFFAILTLSMIHYYTIAAMFVLDSFNKSTQSSHDSDLFLYFGKFLPLQNHIKLSMFLLLMFQVIFKLDRVVIQMKLFDRPNKVIYY